MQRRTIPSCWLPLRHTLDCRLTVQNANDDDRKFFLPLFAATHMVFLFVVFFFFPQNETSIFKYQKL